jgi:hypothetical protein
MMNREPVPALPAAALVGNHYERQRVVIENRSLMLRPFFERHRTWDLARSEADWVEIAGLELVGSGEPFPLLKLPAARVRLGVARILVGPIEESTEWWLSLTWLP